MQTWHKIICTYFLVSVLTCDIAFAQKAPSKTDSTQVYQHIESFPVNHKFTRYFYRLFFKPVSASSLKKTAKKKQYLKLNHKPYSDFEGKTIRKITIETLDPFGYSIADTIDKTRHFLANTANSLHVKSQLKTISNLLLISENKPFDSLLVKESERLVRSRDFVRDVSFLFTVTSKDSDSVDIFIRELDNWSIVPTVAFSSSQTAITLTDRNLAGLGHETKIAYSWGQTTGNYAFAFNYFVPNISNSYITSTLQFATDESGNFIRGIAIDRSFFSPFTKWAGGVNFSWQLRHYYIQTNDFIPVQQPFRFNTQDYWAGKSSQLFKGNTQYERTTNFISALRYIRIRYLEKPVEMYDPQQYFTDEDFYLTSIGISTRNFVQDKYIFKFGLTEDVPVGKAYSLTAGYQVKNNAGRFYLGMRVSSGNYFRWGYLSFNGEYGTFLHASHAEQGVITIGLNYFTGLAEIGRWKFRQFVKPQIIIGLNRFAFDSLTLNNNSGIGGFKNTSLSGNSCLLLTVQTQSYAPWNFIGFRFAPYLTFSIGMLGDAETGFKNSNIYSLLGIGVLIKNEHLVINTFQVSIAYYSLIPGKGQNVFRINSFRTTDFGFRDFEIGRPAAVLYQ
jgi:hypothetical protein